MKPYFLFIPALVFFSNQCLAQNTMSDYKRNDKPIAIKNFNVGKSEEVKEETKNTKSVQLYNIKKEVGTNHIYVITNTLTNENVKYQKIGRAEKMNFKINDTIVLSDGINHFYKGIYKGKRNDNFLVFIDNKEEEIPTEARYFFKEYKQD